MGIYTLATGLILVPLIKEQLTPDLLKGRWKTIPQEHPLQGHCYVGTEALWHLLPDDQRPEWTPMVASYEDKHGRATHWWLTNKFTKERLDVTKAQYSGQPPYHLGRGNGFLTKLPSKRAQIVIDAVRNVIKIETL